MAYKRELIINNGSLTSYKKLLKVSDVCQLHSPKNFRSGASANVSFESTDGKTWVVNGTTDYTGVGRVFFQVSNDKIELIKNHHYLLRGAMKNWYDSTAVNIDNNSAGTIDGLIFEQATTVYEYLYIAVTKKTYTNAIFKPQLFDLTEMYGAGNEPATVAEFKAKFPNDLYDYSPRCWVTSYKTGLIAKTKNLFDKSKAIKGRALRYIDGGEYDDAPYYASDYINVSGISTLTITPTHEIPSVCFYDKNKTFISSTRTMIGVSVPSNAVYIRFDNKLTNLGTCQLEKGSTATDYVPYGYL